MLCKIGAFCNQYTTEPPRCTAGFYALPAWALAQLRRECYTETMRGGCALCSYFLLRQRKKPYANRTC